MTFPPARKGRLGYDVDEVDEFLETARLAYTDPNPDAPEVTSQTVRTTAFALRKSGYSISHVDAALERLEDAFAQRERTQQVEREGDDTWYAEARATAQEILDRVVRPKGRRFRRVSVLSRGYSVTDVDALTDRIADYFQHGAALTTDEVRTSAFRPKRGGYREAQVDYLLDTVVSTMQAVR